MPLPTRWHKKGGKAPPQGFEILEATLEALEHELRDKIKESNLTQRRTESVWPVHQINWQKSRYVYDMYYTYHRISKAVYQYCIDQKLVDAALIAKWKKPGYERLCSTYVINPTNYKFGTTSICRVPWKDRSAEAKNAQDPTTGCWGCASGKGAGPRNIFGNKYGQYLAAVQVAREQRLAEQRRKEEADAQRNKKEAGEDETEDEDDDDDDDEDDEDNEAEDDYGPTPAAGIWAGSQKLEQLSNQMATGGEDDDGEEETDDDDDDDDDSDDEGPSLPPAKKVRTDD